MQEPSGIRMRASLAYRRHPPLDADRPGSADHPARATLNPTENRRGGVGSAASRRSEGLLLLHPLLHLLDGQAVARLAVVVPLRPVDLALLQPHEVARGTGGPTRREDRFDVLLPRPVRGHPFAFDPVSTPPPRSPWCSARKPNASALVSAVVIRSPRKPSGSWAMGADGRRHIARAAPGRLLLRGARRNFISRRGQEATSSRRSAPTTSPWTRAGRGSTPAREQFWKRSQTTLYRHRRGSTGWNTCLHRGRPALEAGERVADAGGPARRRIPGDPPTRDVGRQSDRARMAPFEVQTPPGELR